MKKSNEPTKTKKAMKTIKKFLSMAALALVGAVMTGCSNDDEIIETPQQPVNSQNVETLTTTVGFDEVAETRALTSGGVKTFAAGDQLALVYKNKSGQTVKTLSTALPSGSYSSSATFTFELVNADKTKNVTYIYPASMAKNDGTVNYDALATQNGTLASLASNLDCCTKSAAWDGTSLPTVTLDNQFAICAFTIKNDDGSSDLTSTVTGMTIKQGSYTYTVSRSAAAGPIYVAMRPTSSASISYTATVGSNKYTKSVTGKSYAAGKIYQLGLRMWPEGVLPGRFTINAYGGKVYFSKGNLKYTKSTSTWSFLEPQYTVVEQRDEWVGHNYSERDIVTLFGYGTSGYDNRLPYQTAENYLSTNYYAGGNLTGTNYDWGVYNTISNGGTGWRTLSKDEWNYLANHTHGRSWVAGIHGWVIRPDGVTTAVASSYTAEAWVAEEAAGSLFLPGARYRYSGTCYNIDAGGYYWSATLYNSNEAYYFAFPNDKSTSTYINADYHRSIAIGQSVRLVKNVQ